MQAVLADGRPEPFAVPVPSCTEPWPLTLEGFLQLAGISSAVAPTGRFTTLPASDGEHKISRASRITGTGRVRPCLVSMSPCQRSFSGANRHVASRSDPLPFAPSAALCEAMNGH